LRTAGSAGTRRGSALRLRPRAVLGVPRGAPGREAPSAFLCRAGSTGCSRWSRSALKGLADPSARDGEFGRPVSDAPARLSPARLSPARLSPARGNSSGTEANGLSMTVEGRVSLRSGVVLRHDPRHLSSLIDL
jgi:hypothetical protein